MIINCGDETLTTDCHGCYCHGMGITFGERRGCCVECGCPKTIAAFALAKKRYAQEQRG